MKRVTITLVLLGLLLLLTGCQKSEEVEYMPIRFNADGDGIYFGNIPNLSSSLEQITICARVNQNVVSLDSDNPNYTGYIIRNTKDTDPLTSAPGLRIYRNYADTGEDYSLDFYWKFDGDSDAAHWRVDVITPSTYEPICVTYDNTDTGNDPSFTVGGVEIPSSDVTEVNAPSGTAEIGDDNWYLGYASPSTGIELSYLGLMKDVRFYDVILTSEEIDEYTDSDNDCKYMVPRGLKFWVPGVSVKDVGDFDSVSLSSSSDAVVDLIGGLEGSILGSPDGIGATDPITSAGADAANCSSGVFHRLWFDDDGIHATVSIDTG